MISSSSRGKTTHPSLSGHSVVATQLLPVSGLDWTATALQKSCYHPGNHISTSSALYPIFACPTSQRLQNPIPCGRVALESFFYAGDLLSSLFLIYRLDHLPAPWTSPFETQDLHHHLIQPHPKMLPPHCPHFGKGPQSSDL